MPPATAASQKFVLGLDLGSASLGWALLALDESGSLAGLIDAGVRIFEPGVDGTSLDIELGKDQSKAVDRRVARLHRRQLRRRAARQRELFQLLQDSGLLPLSDTGRGASPEQRHYVLNEFDNALARKFAVTEGDTFAQMPLYILRKRALYGPLEPFELGRVFFHLIQRRGFLSNRKDVKKSGKENEDLGQVNKDISELQQKIDASGAKTLGEYFAGLDPHSVEVRRRWTGRAMFQKEFALIWNEQAPHHSAVMTTELHDSIYRLLFYQRPIAKQDKLIGRCELEPEERRAPWSTLAAQRFRMLQKVNDLLIVNTKTQDTTPLSKEQRSKLLKLLEDKGTQSFIALRKEPEFKGLTFNLEAGGGKEGGEKNIPGNRTRASMLKVFGGRWDEFTEGKQNNIIDNWRKSESDEKLRENAAYWGLDEAATEVLIRESPQSDYCSLSLKAIAKLLPYMADEEKPLKKAEAEKAAGYVRFANLTPLDELPQVREALPTLRNPAVERSMTEMRKVVNAIVRKYGKPEMIRVELARELKKPRGERQEESDKGRRREKERLEAAKLVAKDMGVDDTTVVNRRLIEKVLLWRECGGFCPYTDRRIELTSLWNDSSEFDIEHIIPRSRFPDNSFLNKTLCHQSFNQMKGNRTPYEMYKNSPEEYERLLDRVRAWPIKNRAKLDRFRVGEPGLKEDNSIEGFSARQLNDTRYTSVAAMKLLANLYGGTYKPDGTQVVFATSGKITAALRSGWGLEAILRRLVPPQPGDGRGKPRIDHRHHAIDAITIAATQPRVIEAMARDSAQNLDPRQRPKVPPPWKDFVLSVEPFIERLLVSHRPEHKLSGALHDETNYGKPYKENKKTIVHVRKRVAGLSEKDIGLIADQSVRDAVRAKAADLGGDLSGCDLRKDWPVLRTKQDKVIPIKKVRIRKVLDVTAIGKGATRRYVAESSNHHVAIYAQFDAHGKEKRWDGVIVSLLEAAERSATAQRTEAYRLHHRISPLVQKTLPNEPEQQFKFSLMGGDTVELHRSCKHSEDICTPNIYRIRTIAANGQISLVKITDARMKKEIQAAKEWWSPTADTLRKLDCRKVVVDLLGRVHPAND